jgi:cytochrome c-type biogenesis protein CcmH
MITFIILAAAFTFAAAIAIAVPLLKKDQESTAQSSWTAMAVIAVLVVGGAASYVSLSNWPWTNAPQIEAQANGPDSPLAMVERLKKRLETNPQDLEGWLMLGRSYVVLDQVPLAIRAYEHADRIAGGKNVEALVGLAEALAVQDQNALEGQAGELLEKALQIDPKSDRALFYGGAAALRRGELPLARQRFATLLELNPPDQIKPLLQEQIAAIDKQLGGAPNESAGAGPSAKGAPNEAVAANGAGRQANANGEPNQPAAGAGMQAKAQASASGATNSGPAAIHINVTISPKLSASLPAGAPLFVFVRDPNRPGPPLAVKRLSNRFPQTVELTSADAMVPGRELTDGQQVQVVARIAKSGTPTAQSGDPFGEVGYHVGHDKVVDIVIDRLTP